MLLVWEWLLFHLLKKCYFSHCIFLSLEIGLELTQIIIKSQEKQRKTTPPSPLSALGRLCLSPLGCPDSAFLPFPWWKTVQLWLKTQARTQHCASFSTNHKLLMIAVILFEPQGPLSFLWLGVDRPWRKALRMKGDDMCAAQPTMAASEHRN